MIEYHWKHYSIMRYLSRRNIHL